MIVSAFLLAVSMPCIDNIDRYQVGFRDGVAFIMRCDAIPGRDQDGVDLCLEPSAASAWIDLLERAARDGVVIDHTYAFRTMEQQRALRHRNGRMAARPGFSSHQEGLSVDVSGTRGRAGRQTRRWLREVAPAFGFVNDVKGEPWHLTYRPRGTR